MQLMLFIVVLLVMNSAIWVYFDSQKLRDEHHIGVGPRQWPPQTWGALVFLLWPAFFPLYWQERQKVQSVEQRHGPPPRFETEGLTSFAVIFGLIGFALFGYLIWEGQLRASTLGLAIAAAGVFGGRRTTVTGEAEEFDLGNATFEQVGSVPPRSHLPDDDSGNEPVDLDRWFQPPASAAAFDPAGGSVGAGPSPVLGPTSPSAPPGPHGASSVAGAPSSSTVAPGAWPPPIQPHAAQPHAGQPPRAQTPPGPQHPGAGAAEGARPPLPPVPRDPGAPAAGVPYTPPPPGQPYAPPTPGSAPGGFEMPPMAGGVPAAHAADPRYPQAPAGSPQPPPQPPAVGQAQPSQPSHYSPGPHSPDPRQVAAGHEPHPPHGQPQGPAAGAPGGRAALSAEALDAAWRGRATESQPPRAAGQPPSPPPAAGTGDPLFRPEVPPPPRAAPPRGPRQRAAPPANPYGYAAAKKGGNQTALFWILGIVAVAALGWVGYLFFSVPELDDSGTLGPIQASGAETETPGSEAGPGAEAGPDTDADSGSSGGEVDLERQALLAWHETYEELMSPVAFLLDEVDFDGFETGRCRRLTAAVSRANLELPSCPDSEIEEILRPGLGAFSQAADACGSRDEQAWSFNLLEGKRSTHAAQVMLDERYSLSGILELESESALGVERSPESMSGRFLQGE